MYVHMLCNEWGMCMHVDCHVERERDILTPRRPVGR